MATSQGSFSRKQKRAPLAEADLEADPRVNEIQLRKDTGAFHAKILRFGFLSGCRLG
jgi:hypothetical protein